MKTLKKMNFGENFRSLVDLLYQKSVARVMVNGEMGEEFETKGGVRQGCPLSPYLFLVVLELMAEAIREEEVEGIRMREEDGKEGEEREEMEEHEDKVSLYADDSATFISRRENIKKTRSVIEQYENATGAKLHEGKTKIMRVGGRKSVEMTKRDIGVNFTIMEVGEHETYLGDVIGTNVTEEERFGKILKSIEKTGRRWNAENIGMYGRAIIANTLLLSKLKHRAGTSTMSERMRRRVRDVFRSFMWRGRERAGRRWEVLVKPIKKGGLGIKDPMCAIDAEKIKIIKDLQKKDRQPWKRWVERKLRRLGRRWGTMNVMTHRPSNKQKGDLNKECLVESTMKIWYEIGGGVERMVQKEDGIVKEMGMMFKNGWIALEKLKTKHVYDALVERRLKMRDYEEKRVFKNLKKIERVLTAAERDYWWKLSHNIIRTNERVSRYKKRDDGSAVDDKCPMCKTEVETKKHYDYECSKVKEFINELTKELKIHVKSENSWNLMTKKMKERTRIVIAKARFVYHEERVRMDKNGRRRINLEVLVNRVKSRMEVIRDLI